MHAFSNNDDNYNWFCELTVAQIYGTPVRAVHPVLLPTRGQGTDDDSQFISMINKLMPQKCTVIDQLWVCACDIYLWHWRVLCKSILGDQFVTCFCMDLNRFQFAWNTGQNFHHCGGVVIQQIQLTNIRSWNLYWFLLAVE